MGCRQRGCAAAELLYCRGRLEGARLCRIKVDAGGIEVGLVPAGRQQSEERLKQQLCDWAQAGTPGAAAHLRTRHAYCGTGSLPAYILVAPGRSWNAQYAGGTWRTTTQYGAHRASTPTRQARTGACMRHRPALGCRWCSYKAFVIKAFFTACVQYRQQVVYRVVGPAGYTDPAAGSIHIQTRQAHALVEFPALLPVPWLIWAEVVELERAALQGQQRKNRVKSRRRVLAFLEKAPCATLMPSPPRGRHSGANTPDKGASEPPVGWPLKRLL